MEEENLKKSDAIINKIFNTSLISIVIGVIVFLNKWRVNIRCNNWYILVYTNICIIYRDNA